MRIVLAFILFTSLASAAFAQTPRAYVNASGGFAVGENATSGDVFGQAGARIAGGLSVFGGVGQFHNLEPTAAETSVDTATTTVAADDGLNVIGTSKVPAWYWMGGLRYEAPIAAHFTPYVIGGVGMARLTPHATFAYASGGTFDVTPAVGSDVTANVLSLDAFTSLTPENATMYSVGGGVDFGLGHGLMVDTGYRVSRIQSTDPLHAQSVTFGIGYRF